MSHYFQKYVCLYFLCFSSTPIYCIGKYLLNNKGTHPKSTPDPLIQASAQEWLFLQTGWWITGRECMVCMCVWVWVYVHVCVC